MSTSARVLVPTAITAAMLGGGTSLPEPAVALGEVAWVSGGSYIIGDERTYGGSVYKSASVHSGRTTPPDIDATIWVRQGPTLRTAPFDDYAATKARATGSITYVINPGFVDGANLYGLEGSAYSITVKDAPGGSVVASKSGDLFEQALGLWELLFSPLPSIDRVSLDAIPISPTTEITITVSNGASGPVAIGGIKVGGWRLLIGNTESFGGPQYGANSERKTYTSRIYNVDGTYKTVLRGSYRDINCSLVIDAEQAMYADATLAQVQDIAVPFEACDLPKYGYLATLGFISAKMTAASPSTTSIELNIQGNI